MAEISKKLKDLISSKKNDESADATASAPQQEQSKSFDFMQKLFGEKPSTELQNSPVNATETKLEAKKDDTAAYLKILAENTMGFHMMARDINVARQNVQELVKIMGGELKTGADSDFKTEDQKRKLVDARKGEIKAEEIEKEEKKPTPIKVESKQKSTFFDKMKGKLGDKFKKTKVGKKIGDIKKSFSANSFLKSFKKYFAIAAILGFVFVSFKDTLVEWATSLWETIQEKFTEFVETVKQWFKDVVLPIVEDVKKFIGNMIEKIGEFFKSIGDWFVEKIGSITDTLEPIVATIKNIWDKLTGYVDGFLSWIKSKKEEIAELNKVADERRKLNKLEDRRKKGKVSKEEEADILVKDMERYTENGKLNDAMIKQLSEKGPEHQKALEKAGYKVTTPAPVTPAPAPVTPAPVRKADAVPTVPEQTPMTVFTPEPVSKFIPTPKSAPTSAPVSGTELRTGYGGTVSTGYGGTVVAAAVPSIPTTIPKATPSKEKKDEKPLEVSGTQALIIDSLKQSGIYSPKAHANVLATVKAESNFKVQSENLNYTSPERIQAVFGKRRIPTVEFAQQFVRNPEALANHVYKITDGNSQPGDGFKYRGRGFIQHTGKNQYAALAKGSGIDVLNNPDSLNSPEIAAKVIPWFFLSYKKMKPEDLENMSKVNSAVAFSDPTGQKAIAREKSAEQIYASMPITSGIQVASASSDVSSGQRQQQKPSTPVIVNASTTNNTVVQENKIASASKPQTTSSTLIARAA